MNYKYEKKNYKHSSRFVYECLTQKIEAYDTLNIA